MKGERDASREEEAAEAQTAPVLADSSIDNAAFAMDVLTTVVTFLNKQPRPSSGETAVSCPRCTALGRTGVVRVAWVKRKGSGRHAQSFSAACEHQGCIRFAGH